MTVAAALLTEGTLNAPLASSPFVPTGASVILVLSAPESSVSLAVAPSVSCPEAQTEAAAGNTISNRVRPSLEKA